MAAPGPLSHQQLGDKYLLGNLLGQGGFGAVYQARHTLLNRQQAIKILLEQHWTLPKFRERFIREAQTLAGLDHPNIVHVDDFGFDGNRAYLVMPYIGGGTLQSILKSQQRPQTLADVTRYLEQIAGALDYAHARNVAHLDLKPLNLLVHADGRLLLSDFGLAHLMEQGAIEGSTSLQFGTPVYMAPEHLQGQPERRSDIYALGIMLYQMLTGRLPFVGSTPAAIMLKHLTEPPPPLRSARPELPASLEGVLLKALAKRPEDRYQTAGALLTEFKAAIAGQPAGQLRYSQPLDTTIRAANPPVWQTPQPLIRQAGELSQPLMPPPGGSGPMNYQQPVVYMPLAYQPVVLAPPRPRAPVSQTGKVWTQGFIGLFIGAVVVAGVLTLIGALNLGAISVTTRDQIILLAYIAWAVICLVGLRFATSRLMRVGIGLQGLSAITAIILSGINLSFDASRDFSNYPLELPAHLVLMMSLLNLVSLVCVSYALVRWKPIDGGLMVLQIISTIIVFVLFHGGVFFYYLRFINFFEWRSLLYFAPSWEQVAVAACIVFPATLLVFRFACWKRQPIAIFCLALGQTLPVVSFILPLKYLIALYLVTFLPMLGFLVIIRGEQLRKQYWSAVNAIAASAQTRR